MSIVGSPSTIHSASCQPAPPAAAQPAPPAQRFQFAALVRALRATLDADQMTMVRTYIESAPTTIGRTANAKLVAHLLSGKGPIASVPCPVSVLLCALTAWHEREAVTHYKDPAPGTLITLCDECWGDEPSPPPPRASRQHERGLNQVDVAPPANLPPRATDTHAVWIVGLGMTDYSSPHHPARGLPDSAVLVGQLYRLPKQPPQTPTEVTTHG
jgi:hypothetical protein